MWLSRILGVCGVRGPGFKGTCFLKALKCMWMGNCVCLMACVVLTVRERVKMVTGLQHMYARTGSQRMKLTTAATATKST